MTDEEVYKGEFYRGISRGIFLAFLSGVLCSFGGLIFWSGIKESIIISIVAFLLSVFLLMTARFVGLHKLFPKEDEQNGN